jgi:signal transduction histidine kinase
VPRPTRALPGTSSPADAADAGVEEVPTDPPEPSLRDLGAAVLAGGEVEDVLELLVGATVAHARARDAALVLPTGTGGLSLEVVAGADRDLLWGAELEEDMPLREALTSQDVTAARAADLLDLGEDEFAIAVSVVDAADAGLGALVALRSADGRPFTREYRVRLDAIALLAGFTLGQAGGMVDTDLEDERTRIARDLHDLAIQELFAVGMELEGLTETLSRPGATLSGTEVRRTVESSLHGVENAVAQIRQIIQSLRRERSEATLSERLRHETGLATAGLGFAPTLRLPADPTAMDTEIPDEIAEDVVAVVRESLANAARHAHASAVAVAVSVFSEGVDRVIQVSVSDNGRGIDPSVTRRSGLANMSSRARRHSGWVDAIGLEPGTMINWRVTLPPR